MCGFIGRYCGRPRGVVPVAAFAGGARVQKEGLRHAAGRHRLVGPDTSIRDFATELDMGRVGEEFAAEGEHAAGETGEVLPTGVEVGGVGFVVLEDAREEDIVVFGRHGAEEEMVDCGGHGGFVEFLVHG